MHIFFRMLKKSLLCDAGREKKVTACTWDCDFAVLFEIK